MPDHFAFQYSITVAHHNTVGDEGIIVTLWSYCFITIFLTNA
jgi:hypothetical protein